MQRCSGMLGRAMICGKWLAVGSFAVLLTGCATPAPNLPRLAVRAAETYGPQCEAAGPVNTQAWGVCVGRAYNSAVAAHGGSCTQWEGKASSFPDCVMNESVRGGIKPAGAYAGPYCIAMDVGGGVDPSACR